MPARADRPNHPALIRIADWSYRRRRRVVVLWVLALLITNLLAAQFKGDFKIDFSTPGSGSQRAQTLLEQRFPARAGDTIDVVYRSDGPVTAPATRSAVESLLTAAAKVPHVIGVISPYSQAGARQVSPKGDIAYATLQLDVGSTEMPRTDSKELLQLAKAANRPGLQVDLSGFAIENAQQGSVGSDGIGFIVAAVILLIAFGSVLAMGLPILIALFGLGIATALIGLIANVVTVPQFATIVAGMIGIGVGIDYVLFIVTRYRTTLAEGKEPREAIVMAIATAGRAVMFAGCTVIISLLGLFIIGLSFLQGVALAAVSAVLVVMLASVTLLPAVLGFVGRTIDRLHVPLVGRRHSDGRGSFWYRWSRIVQRRPWPAAIISFGLLAVLIAPAFSMHFGFPDAGTDPSSYTTRRSYDLLTEGFGPGFNGPFFVVTTVAGGGQPQVTALQSTLAHGIAGVAAASPPVYNPSGDVAMIAVYPTSSPQATATNQLLRRIRDSVGGSTRFDRLDVTVGGSTASTVDQTDYLLARLPYFIGAVILLSFLLLMTVFRSVLVALKAALMNVLSIGAAYGVVGEMVKGGTLGGFFGLHDPIPVPSFMPMMMFAILFGLSMDYEVFLLSRIREEYAKSGDNGLAVADGLAATARVITAAGAIMVSVFLSFVLGDQALTKIIGVGLATAIFVDATLVRMVLVPSTMELLGNANWWVPRWLDRILPHFHVEADLQLDAELHHLLDAEGVPAPR